VDFAVADLAIVLDRSVSDLVRILDDACAAGVLAASGKRLRFRHPLIRSALYEEMPEPVRAAWHREAGRALAEAGAPADRVARQLLLAVGDLNEAPEPMDEWMLSWLADVAGLLVSQAPQVAAELLRQAVESSPAGARHDRLAARLSDALYRVGDVAGAGRLANQTLAHSVEPELLTDLHWTLAQCRIYEGLFAESIATLDRALASPGISARDRARLLVLAARTHSNFGAPEEAGRVAVEALAVASEAGDNWAMGWALLMMALVASIGGRMTDALPLFDRALAVTKTDAALGDMRLLVQINKAITLGTLDRYEEALSAAGQARDLADRVGATMRLSQAHGALAQLLFQTGQWDEALAEAGVLPGHLKEPGAACCEIGIAAVIAFHRGDVLTAQRHLATAVPYAERLGRRHVGPLALARSLDHEQADALPEALAALTDVFSGGADDLEEVEDLLADVVRLAIETGDLARAHAFAGQAASLAAGSEIPHRQANALYCHGLLDHDASRLLIAAERYADAGRPLLRAQALEAAAGEFARVGERDQARDAAAGAAEIYTRLGAAVDAARVQTRLSS
jgi:tetratricopeptide (TPR) repeat protein